MLGRLWDFVYLCQRKAAQKLMTNNRQNIKSYNSTFGSDEVIEATPN